MPFNEKAFNFILKQCRYKIQERGFAKIHKINLILA